VRRSNIQGFSFGIQGDGPFRLELGRLEVEHTHTHTHTHTHKHTQTHTHT
jgi:hypothetical protein